MPRYQAIPAPVPKVPDVQVRDRSGLLSGNGKLVWAKRPIGYDGEELDRGQLFRLKHCKNDEKLLRINYVGEPPDEDSYTCVECGGEFIGIAERDAHGKNRHSSQTLTPFQEDERQEREERMLAQVAPLDLSKTKASSK